MASLGSLLVDLQVNTAALRKGLDEATGMFAAFGKQLQGIGKDLHELTEMKAVEFGKEIITGLAEIVQGGAEAAEHMLKLSQATGVPVAEFSKLAFAAQTTGVGSDDLAHSLEKLDKNLALAGAGARQQADLFKVLGIAVKDAGGNVRPTGAVLGDLAELFSGLQDGASKTALAIDLFGKSGAEMIPFLNEGRAGISQLEAEADRLGITLSDSSARAAKELEDNLVKLKAAGQAVATHTAGELAPMLTKLTNQLLSSKDGTNALKQAVEVLATAFRLIVSAGIIVSSVFDAIGTTLAHAASAIVDVLHGKFSAIGEFAKASIGVDVVDAGKSAVEKLKTVWADGTGAEQALEKQDTAVKKSADLFISQLQRMKDGIAKLKADWAKRDDDAMWATKAKVDTEVVKSSAHTDREASQRQSDFSNVGTGPNQIFKQLTAGFQSFSGALEHWTSELKLAAIEQGEVKIEEESAARARQLASELEKKGDVAGAAAALALAEKHDAAAREAQVLADKHTLLATSADKAAKAFDQNAQAAEQLRQAMLHIGQLAANATPSQRLEEIHSNTHVDLGNLTNTELSLQQRWQVVMDLGGDVAGAIKQTLRSLGDSFSGLNNIGGAIGVFASSFVSKLGKLGEVINAGIQGFQQGGIWGAIAAVIMELMSMVPAFKRITDIANGQLMTALSDMSSGLGDLIGGFRELMGGIGIIAKAIHGILNPILSLLGQILKGIAPIFAFIGHLLEAVGDALKEIIPIIMSILKPVLQLLGWLLTGLAEIVLAVKLAFEYVWAGIIHFLNAILGWADHDLQNTQDQADQAIVDTKQEMANLWQHGLAGEADAGADAAESLGATSDAANKTTTALQKMTAQLTNVPEGFKIALARFNATQSRGQAFTAGNGADAKGGVHIDNLIIQATGIDDLYNKLYNLHRRKTAQAGGPPFPPH